MSRRLVLVLAIGSACGHPVAPDEHPVPPARAVAPPGDAATGPLDRDLPRLAARGLALYQEVARAFAASGADCAAATAKLAALQTTYADFAPANEKVLRDGRARELRQALEPHQEAFEAAAQAIARSETMAKCAADKAFEDAFDRLVGSPP